MGEKATPTYLLQLKAMLIRNLLLKKREKRKTIAVSTVLLVYVKLLVFAMEMEVPKTNCVYITGY